LPGYYRSAWRGAHPLAAENSPGPSLIEEWRASGRQTILVTDEPLVSALPEAREFDLRAEVEPETTKSAAGSVAQTHFAELIGATIERIGAARPPFALWLHARGLSGAWDAPLSLREHLRDEEDPPAAEFVTPPALRLAKDFDPDELLPITQAYAAQAMTIDECLESLLEALAEAKLLPNATVVITSPRGYLLGQQGYVGGEHDALLNDLLHVPLLVRFADGHGAGERGGGLREPRDLYELCRGGTLPAPRDRVLVRTAHERVLRTPAWHLRRVGEERPQLFAKPDDRHEVNDVAARCRDIVEELSAIDDATAAALASGREGELPPLPESLADLWR
jgi:hypothetical protein